MPGTRLYGESSGGQSLGGSGGLRLYDPSDVWETKPQEFQPSKEMELFPGTMQGLADLQVDPFSLKADSSKVISDYFKGIGESIVGAGESLRGAFDEAKGGTFSGTVGKSLEAGARTLGAVISPISSAFQAAENIPGWGSAAKLINTAFGALGEGTTAVSDKVIDSLPIDEKVKENIKPGIAEALTLATQILAGGLAEKGFRIGKPKIDELTNKYGKEDAQTIVEKAVEIAREQKPEVKLAETTGKGTRLYEPKRLEPTATLPQITPKITIKPESRILDIQTQIEQLSQVVDSSPLKRLSKYESKARPGELPEMTGERAEGIFRQKGDQIVQEIASEMGHPEWDVKDVANAYERYAQSRNELNALRTELGQVKGETFKDYSDEQLSRINQIAQSATDVSGEYVSKPLSPVGTGKTYESGLARGVEEMAIEKNLTQGFGDLPAYQRVNMREQARLAKEFIRNNPDRALEIALGRQLPPSGILPESIFIGVESRALKSGDVTTLRSLATESGLALEATAMGQRIRTLAERNPDSPVSAMSEIRKAREERVVDPIKSKERIKTEIKKEIKKPSKEDWSSFVDELVC